MMTLKEYFKNQPHGAVTNMANKLNVSRTWLSLVINNRAVPSAILCVMIERLTGKKVKRNVLRPDLYSN